MTTEGFVEGVFLTSSTSEAAIMNKTLNLRLCGKNRAIMRITEARVEHACMEKTASPGPAMTIPEQQHQHQH